jgi:hypothetical protein
MSHNIFSKYHCLLYVVLHIRLSSYKSYNQMPAEFYGILSRLFLIDFTVFYLIRLEYTRSENNCQCTESGIATRPLSS